MTIEEKRKVINQYCYTHICGECALNNASISKGWICIDRGTQSEDQLDRALALIRLDGYKPPTSSVTNGSLKKIGIVTNANRYFNFSDSKITVTDTSLVIEQDDKTVTFPMNNVIAYTIYK